MINPLLLLGEIQLNRCAFFIIYGDIHFLGKMIIVGRAEPSPAMHVGKKQHVIGISCSKVKAFLDLRGMFTLLNRTVSYREHFSESFYASYTYLEVLYLSSPFLIFQNICSYIYGQDKLKPVSSGLRFLQKLVYSLLHQIIYAMKIHSNEVEIKFQSHSLFYMQTIPVHTLRGLGVQILGPVLESAPQHQQTCNMDCSETTHRDRERVSGVRTEARGLSSENEYHQCLLGP